ncbi:MAG: hypothetical protein ABF711_02540 [Leuconostoc mesenteroides]
MMQENILPFEFEKKLYGAKELNERREWYIEQVNITYDLLKENKNRDAIQFFRSYNNLLKEEYHYYNLSRVNKVLMNNIESDRIKLELRYINWVNDVYANQVGRTTMKNIGSRLFDYKDYVIFHAIE